ncbi:hypothetical protein Ddye_015187 [Dipteronia dyeriana]|uniref:Uncharacterized protein n=1 Tax=Dipteronia dyeriana TaxID=168575 RepID=A0AAD9U518_9ROSI|nr:hypothetical protein Ddye_015187 [Dipteronia dyeriana]
MSGEEVGPNQFLSDDKSDSSIETKGGSVDQQGSVSNQEYNKSKRYWKIKGESSGKGNEIRGSEEREHNGKNSTSTQPAQTKGLLEDTKIQINEEGGLRKKWCAVSDFREAVEDYNLEDMGFTGPKFTWSNKREGASSIAERLDRGLCNDQWKGMFPNYRVKHLDFWGSDHRPMILELFASVKNRVNGLPRNGRRFFFEECWSDEKDCKDTVSSSWSGNDDCGSSMVAVLKNIKVCRNGLGEWNGRKRAELHKEIFLKRKELRLANKTDIPTSWKRIAIIEEKLDVALHTEERYWKQRARMDWLKNGDRN